MNYGRCLVPFAFAAACAPATAGLPNTPAVAAAPANSPPPSAASTPAASTSAAAAPASLPPAELVTAPLPLPGANGPASLDFIFYEPGRSRVWVPAGSTGSVDVLDVASGAFTRIGGFRTAEREAHGKKRVLGPSSGSVGDGFAYIGNRASHEVCAVELSTLKPGKCLALASAPDGVKYVAFSKELWVTLPQEQTISVLDASTPGILAPKANIKLDGSPECYDIDATHGTFFTNLEDKDATVAIDVKTRSVAATWHPGCGPEGPRGVAFDQSHDFVVVACTDHVQVLDVAHAGALLGRLDTGAGLDNIDYDDGAHLLYAAAGKAARLTVARLSDAGTFDVVAVGETSEGARNAVADAHGRVYVADSQLARLLVLKAKP